MKTIFLSLALLLYPFLLSAQFHFRLNLDDTGLYSVVVKTEEVIHTPIVGSGQVTITAPLGGFEVGEITSINGTWNGSVDIIDQRISAAIPHDYFIVGLRDGDGIQGMNLCEEQTLFTFRNVGINTGRAALITDEDPIITKEIDLNNNPNHDLSTFDSSTGRLHNVDGIYQEATITTHTELTKTIFEGDSYLFHGRELTESGTYQDTLQNSNGCDSILVLDLIVLSNENTQTLVLQPDADQGKDAMVWEDNGRYGYADDNYGTNDRLLVHAWTNGGTPDFTRSLIDFDFDQIPSGAIITSAKLTLYNNPTTPSFSGEHQNENAGYVQRVTSAWEETMVTWNNQPSYSEQNKVSYGTLSGNENLEELNVTMLVQDMVADPANSHGFMLGLQTEQQYRATVFASSDHSNAELHPKLEITYEVKEDFVELEVSQCEGEIYDFNGEQLTESGIYIDTLQNRNGFDSVISLTLTVLDVFQTTISNTICEGEAYEFNGQSLTTSGGYQDTLVASNGCDSIIVLDLIVLSNENTQTLVLQPDANQGKDAMVWEDNGRYGYADDNYGTNDRLLVHAWTNGGTPDFTRSLIDFDFDQIPSGAIITSAKLTLYNNPTTPSFSGKHQNENAGYVQRVTSAWEETLVTWNNQPSYSEQNKVSYGTLSGNENLEELNVTTLVKDMIADPANSHGFMLGLQREQQHRATVFASSDHSNASLHPKLEITYTVPNEIILRDTICQGESYEWNGIELTTSGTYQDTLQNSNGCDSILVLNLTVHSDSLTQTIVLNSNGALGKDASVYSRNPDVNADEGIKFHVFKWTYQGTPMAGRSLMDFDLGQIPSNATILNASLSLFGTGDPELDLGEHSTRSGSNASYLERIISPWDESTVTWNNQPTTTTTNRISLPETTSSDQDFLDVDITALVEDMMADSANSHGFMMRLQTEVHYRNLSFYTSDYADASKHPKLEITYTVSNPIIVRDTICQGESYDFNGELLTEEGTYMDTLQNSNGCNSISTLELIVLDSSSSICNVDTTETPIDTVANLVMTNIQRRGSNCLYVEWSPIEDVIDYQLEVRPKGMDNWEDIEILKTDAAKAYIYGPVREGLECRIKMNYPNDEQIISDIFDLSEPLED